MRGGVLPASGRPVYLCPCGAAGVVCFGCQARTVALGWVHTPRNCDACEGTVPMPAFRCVAARVRNRPYVVGDIDVRGSQRWGGGGGGSEHRVTTDHSVGLLDIGLSGVLCS